MNNFTNEELDVVAEKLYDFACANRADNVDKKGNPGDPRKVGCKYEQLFDEAKTFYRNLAKWHFLNK